MNKGLFVLNKGFNYIIMIIVIIMFSSGITNFLNKSNEVDTAMIKSTINSALMQCYALEGAYPSSIYHLEDYGIWINEDKYYYYYEYYDGGIMPTVEVVVKP